MKIKKENQLFDTRQNGAMSPSKIVLFTLQKAPFESHFLKAGFGFSNIKSMP